MKHRRVAALLTAVIALVGVVTVGAPAAQAASCTSPVKYSPSSNTLYLVLPQTYTLTSIKAACMAAPITEVDPSTQTWELSADLILQNGATLTLHGSSASQPGDVNTLRIHSAADNGATDVNQLTAKWGTIDADSVTVTSWDDAAGAPDTNTSLPSGSPSTARARAFIRALSYLDTGSTPRTSTMNIVNSTFEYLGYYASETYGVVYKTEGCDHASGYNVCQAVFVTGEEVNSTFHGNYMGTYAWGANGINFTGSSYDHNTMYGLDPHDVSRNLLIDHDHFTYNGDHGMICSQRCDHLTITNNESDHNGMVPWRGPDPDDSGDTSAGQVHGIMLHRGVTNTVIENNYVHDQPNGAGIAIFDTAGTTVSGNTIANCVYGIRLSVGSASNTFTSNSISNSSQYAVYMYKGSDSPTYTTPNGHPTGNTFSQTTVNGTTSNIVKLSEADNNIFDSGTFAGGGSGFSFYASSGNVLSNDVFPVGQKIGTTGTSSEPGSTAVANPVSTSGPVTLAVSDDTNSKTDVTSTLGTLSSIKSPQLSSTVSSTGSDLLLSYGTDHSTSSVTVTAQPLALVDSTGADQAVVTSASATAVTWTLTAGAVGNTVAITVTGLHPSAPYTLSSGGTTLGTGTSTSTGVITFSITTTSTATTPYSVAGG